jgi:hypothetical protein
MCGGRYGRQKEGRHGCRSILFFEEAKIREELRSGKDKVYLKPNDSAYFEERFASETSKEVRVIGTHLFVLFDNYRVKRHE